MSTKIVLVAGGRNYLNHYWVYQIMDRTRANLGDFVTLTGACPTGVDSFAEGWAKSRQLPYIGCPARWFEHDRAAGMIRNREMLKSHHVDYGIIFPGGRGTAHMRDLLIKAKIPVWQLDT